MAEIFTNELGNITISENVIASLAGIATTECYGIVGMSSTRKVKDGLAEIIHRENIERGVEVKIIDNEIEINLYIVVSYGIKISEVSNSVIERVNYTIEKFIGIKASKINVYVQGVQVNFEK